MKNYIKIDNLIITKMALHPYFEYFKQNPNNEAVLEFLKKRRKNMAAKIFIEEN